MSLLKDSFINLFKTKTAPVPAVSLPGSVKSAVTSTSPTSPILGAVKSTIKGTPSPVKASLPGALAGNGAPVSRAPAITSSPSATSTIKTPAAQSYVNSISNSPTSYQYSNNDNSLLGSNTTLSPIQPIGGGSTTPANDPRQSFIDAYKSYQDAQTQNQDVQEAKKAYNSMVADQAKIIASKEGQGRGITTDIVRGQQRLYKEQTDPELARAQNEIGFAQDAYNQRVAAAKSGADLQQQLLDSDVKNNAPFNLGKDEIRYDSQGNVIARGASSTNAAGGSYTPGLDPTADAYIKGVQNGTYKISDIPDAYKGIVAQGLSNTPKAQSETSKNIVNVIDELIGKGGALGNISGVPSIGSFLPGTPAKLTEGLAKQLAGMLSLENRTQLKGSGAISDFEFKVLQDAASALGINPNTGRTSLSDADFISQLNKVKQNLAGASGGQLAPDEEAYLRSKGYSDADINAYKQQSFNNVGNTTVSIPQTSRLAYVNNNPGNLRFAGQPGASKGQGGFAKFSSPEAGATALQNQIILDASRGLTLGQFINKYAPPSENDTNTYLQQIARSTGASANTPILNIDLSSLTKAIAQKESGTHIA